MWDERGLCEHVLRKRQTSQIISRIEAKQYMEMRKHHSEGSEVAADYTYQLRHAVRKSKTQKMTYLQHKNQRKQLITQVVHHRSKLLGNIQPHFSQPTHSPNEIVQQAKSGRWEEEEVKVLNNAPLKKNTGIQYDSKGDSEESQQQQKIPANIDKVQQHQTHRQTALVPTRTKVNKHFLPSLELFIEEQKALSCMNTHQKRIRNLIVAMMILAINRRQNGRFLEALDVLLQTEIYFPPRDKQMTHLKSVWLSLIGKIYQQIKSSLKTKRGRDRWRKTTKKSTIKTSLQFKRQKTIFIRSLASRKIFLDKFSQNLRKSKLIYESTYMNQLKNPQNQRYKNEQEVKVMSTIGDLVVSYPQPQEMFSKSQGIINYAIVLVRKDQQANLFSLNYPDSLVGFIRKEDYIANIVKINSFLIPTASCFNFDSALYSHYELILCLLIVLLITSILLITSTSRMASLLFITLAVILIGILSGTVHGAGQDSISQRGRAERMIEQCCRDWQKQHQLVKLEVHGHCDVLTITYPIDIDLSEEPTSNAIDPSSKQTLSKQTLQLNRKYSIKLNQNQFVNPLEQVKEDSSDDNELNAQFWRQLEAKAQEPCFDLKRKFQQEIVDQSEDQVITPPPIADWEFQMIDEADNQPAG